MSTDIEQAKRSEHGQPGGAAPSSTARAAGSERAFEFIARYGLIVILVGLVALFSALRPETFFTVTNLRLVLSNQVVTVIVALAATIPLLAHLLDASVGPMLGLAQGLVVWLIGVVGVPIPVAIIAVLMVGAVVGLTNAFLVIRLGLRSIIATLATGSVLMGLLYLTTGGRVISTVPESFTTISRGDVAGIPLLIVYLVVIAALLEVLVSWTPFGQRMYSMDGNMRGANQAGIPVNQYTVRAFVLAALLASAAGVLIAAQIGSGQPTLGNQFLLPAFAAAFLGAAVLRPGRVNVVGTVIAAYVVSVTIAGLQHLGAETWVEDVFNGLALIVGVAVAQKAVERRRLAATRQALRLETEAN